MRKSQAVAGVAGAGIVAAGGVAVTARADRPVRAALIAGFQCVPPPDLAGEYARISDQIRRWRAAGRRCLPSEDC